MMLKSKVDLKDYHYINYKLEHPFRVYSISKENNRSTLKIIEFYYNIQNLILVTIFINKLK
jgi:hypothetical protein